VVDVTPNDPYPGCSGTAQLLTANLSGGGGPFTYQWTEDGIEIPGATSPTYLAENTGTHTYNCMVWGDGCISSRTDVEDVELSWQAEPFFTGIDSVTNSQEETCSLDLAWTPAVPACDGPSYYNVYRSTTTGFIPGPENLHIAGLADVSYRDADDLVYGSRYYYVVRAEDDSNGAEDANTVELSARPSGPDSACTTSSACTMTVNVTPNGITSVCNGDDIVFTAVPNGGIPPYGYQWTRDGADLPGETGDSLTVSHVSAQAHTYNCRVDDSDLCVDVIDGLDATGEWASCTATVTVPDGSEGGTEPLRVGKDGDDLAITWDVSTPACSSPGYHLIWGFGNDVGSYGIAGSDCTLDDSGNHSWVASPDTSLDWAWFLVVGNDGATTEGGWGVDSTSNQRSTGASQECGTLVLDTESCIP